MLGVSRWVDPLLAEDIGLCRRQSTTVSGSVMSHYSPRGVMVVNTERALFVAHRESLAIGCEYRSMTTLRLRSGVTLCDLIEREGEGS